MTALEYFEYIDPINYKLFIDEVIRQGRQLRDNKDSISSVINKSISWGHANAGSHFWSSLHEKYLYITIPEHNAKYYI